MKIQRLSCIVEKKTLILSLQYCLAYTPLTQCLVHVNLLGCCTSGGPDKLDSKVVKPNSPNKTYIKDWKQWGEFFCGTIA